MAINVYYTQQGKKLTLFTDNIQDFDLLNNFLLWAEKLGTKPDEDIVPLRIIKSLPLQNQITIISDFLFTKMPRLSWAPGGSIIGMLQDNGFVLTSLPKEKTKSSWENLASSFNIYSLRSLFYGYKGKKLVLSTDEIYSLIEQNKTNISETELAEKYGISVSIVQKITKYI